MPSVFYVPIRLFYLKTLDKRIGHKGFKVHVLCISYSYLRAKSVVQYCAEVCKMNINLLVNDQL